MRLKTKLANKIIFIVFFYIVLLTSCTLLVSTVAYNRLLPEDFKDLQIELLKLLVILGVVFLVGAVLVIGLVIKQSVAPIEEVVRVVEGISKGDYTKRVGVKSKELDELVVAVNKVIDEMVGMKQDFDEQIKRVKELDKTKSEFISIAAHQLRTPLSAIKWTLKMMMDGDIGDITVEQKEFLRRGYITNERMISLVNDLLNVSRIEEGRFGYEFKVTAIEDIIENLLKTASSLIQEKNINFSLNKPSGNIRKIKADFEKLTLALENILNNAIKYTPPHGKINMTVEDKDNELTITIIDTGVGVPKDQLAKLFTKFFRGSNVIRLQTDGSGLGLFITKNVVEKHGGSILIQSEESKGTRVTITLPFLEPKVISSEQKFEEFIKGF